MKQRPANSRIRHGTASCADYGCGRPECLEARRTKKKQNKYLLATGRPGYVNSGPAAAHLRKFRNAGMQDKVIMGMVGIGRTTYYRVMNGGPITRASEQKILAVPAPAAADLITTTATVDATGTHRRLQALIWLGWPREELEARLGVHPYWVNRSFCRFRVRLFMAGQVSHLYNSLWSVPPETQGVPAGLAEEARQYARSQSWHGPLAWDDDTIDDPKAVAQTDATQPVATEGGNVAERWLLGESVILRAQDRKQVIQHLFEWTELTVEEIAARVESTPAAVDQMWNRLKKQARVEGRPVPWRRVYALRDKDLTKNDMEEVA